MKARKEKRAEDKKARREEAKRKEEENKNPFLEIHVTDEPWKMTPDQYQHKLGVPQPHIAEISPYQYANMSERGKSEYDKKRREEWSRSGMAKGAYSVAVIKAFNDGKFKYRDPDATKEAKECVCWHFRRIEEERKKQITKETLQSITFFTTESINVGDRVWDGCQGAYGTVIKIFKKSVRLKYEKKNAMFPELTVSPRRLCELSPQDENKILKEKLAALPDLFAFMREP